MPVLMLLEAEGHQGERNPRQMKPYVLLECVQDLNYA